MPRIRLQPKQTLIAQLLEQSDAPWIGMFGGRGCAKSYTLDALMLRRRAELAPGTVGCIVMRNYDQVLKYHIQPMMRLWPELEDTLNKSEANIKIPVVGGFSQIDFSYAENLLDVERRFRSANYYDIFVDQAEQFMPEELREMKKACRWPGTINKCKMLLSFNMGGAGIQGLRKWFHTHEVGARERPEDFAGVHVFPWDNVEWSRAALAEDGLTAEDYYSWTDEQRMEYCASRSDFGKALNSEDDALRNRDWLGSWDSLEGAYYGRVFDRASMLLDRTQVQQLVQPWDTRWLSQDWGKQHYNVTYWHAVTQVSPERAKRILNWDIERPFKAVVTYRELVVNELASADVAQRIIDATPESERKQIKSFFLSPDAFGERDSENTTADNLGTGLRRAGLPEPEPADTERAGGWMLLYDLMRETKRHASTGGDCWLIGAECPVLLESIPLLMRDPKDLDVVLKTDKGSARLDQDSSECFVADTPILTTRGTFRIADVKTGDEVLTAYGPRRVAHAWKARRCAPVVEASFSNGVRLRCTEDHLFWTENRGYAPLNSLRYGDKLVQWTPSLTTERSILGSGNTIATSDSCIASSGKMPMGRSRRAATFTTLTAIARITISRIWNALRLSSTWPCIQRSEGEMPRIWNESGHLRRLGIALQRDAHGLSETPRLSDLDMPWMLRACASNAGSASWGNPGISSVQTPASRHGGVSRGLTMKIGRAKPAESSLESTSTSASEHVQDNAVRFLGFVQAGYADVYDIETEDVHQFFAGGILVHNSARYGLKSFLKPRTKAPLAVQAAEVYARVEDPHNRGMAMAQFWAKNKPRGAKPNWRPSATI